MTIKSSNREPIDGVDTLRRRVRTRLWYRRREDAEETISPLEALAQSGTAPAIRLIKRDSAPRSLGTDRLVRESASLEANLRKAVGATADGVEKPAAQPDSPALTDWRDAPSHCPVLLLSASALLDARNPGPILGPGARYRILSLADGVAALEVAALDGHVGAGYCNAVDLTCVEPNIANLRREGGGIGRGTARLSLNRISQRLAGVTAALVG